MREAFILLGLIIINSVYATGCAIKNYAKEANIAVERVDSSSVKLTHAYIAETSEGLELQGKLKRKRHSHVPVGVHIHVELVDSNGTIIKTVELDPRRKANSDHISKFYTILPQDAVGNTVKIVHHDALSHKQESTLGVWQDN